LRQRLLTILQMLGNDGAWHGQRAEVAGHVARPEGARRLRHHFRLAACGALK